MNFDFDKLLLLCVAWSAAEKFHHQAGMEVYSAAANEELTGLILQEVKRIYLKIPEDYDWENVIDSR